MSLKDNIYVESQENAIRKDRRRNIERHISVYQAILLVVVLLFCVSRVCAMPMVASSVPTSELFPDCWICKKCGYDNYNGINTCGICGGCK